MGDKGGTGSMIGRTLHHFEIKGKLGEGGMGVVYKARDAHLDRFVALKVLPPERVSDPDRKCRFIQEAKAASALNHPGIVTIYDIHHADGIDYIAMEWVDGRTLNELITRRGMRLNEVFTYSVQIADALAAAHAAGIVHRDLKPANIMVTEKGLVKVLDFGLAKLTEPVGSDELMTTETLQPHTEEGTIVGTVAYMSPEQAEGKKVDARSDIFSFGSVLYEMVTGQKAFQGTGKMSTLSAILHQEPKPIGSITPAIPADLEKLINRCQRKDPERRIQHMDDVKLALLELKEDSDSGKLAAGAVTQRRGRSYLWISMILVAGAILAVGAWQWLRSTRSAAEGRSLTPVPLTAYPGTETYPSFSPDGSQVAYQGCPGGWVAGQNCDIYVKQIGIEPPSRLTDTPEQEYCPAWSPDGRFIAFLRQISARMVGLVLIPQRGGRERVLAELELDIPSYLGLYGPSLAWTPDSKSIACPAPDGAETALYLISVETGEKKRITKPPPCVSECGDTSPAFSPDGRSLVFSRSTTLFVSGLWLLRLGEGYGPQGEPERISPGTASAVGTAFISDGKEILFSSGDSLWRVAASASAEPRRLPLASDNAHTPAISRKGNQLAFSVEKTDRNIWRVDLQGPDFRPGVPFRFISSTREERFPSISPDGKRIAFYSERSGEGGIWLCDRDGSNPVRLSNTGGAMAMSWSPDSQSILFQMEIGGNQDIYAVNVDGVTPRRLTIDPASESWPFWSQDGQWIYFRSNRGGTSHIWKMPAGGGGAVQININTDDLDAPRESLDGRFLYFSMGWPGPNSVWRVPVEGGEPTEVLDGVHPTALWTVAENGIYFFTSPDKRGYSDLCIYEFATERIRKLLTVERPVTLYVTVSRDGRTVLYTQVDEAGSDLMLVENFR
jgi:Tol biopolymer transport system component